MAGKSKGGKASTAPKMPMHKMPGTGHMMPDKAMGKGMKKGK